MSEILHLNLHRKFFNAIASRQKRIEYRKQSPYWRKRLEDRKYDAIQFRNGYAKDAPEMLVEYRGSVVMDGAATLTTPSVLGTFYGSGVGEVKRYPLMGVNRMKDSAKSNTNDKGIGACRGPIDGFG